MFDQNVSAPMSRLISDLRVIFSLGNARIDQIRASLGISDLQRTPMVTFNCRNLFFLNINIDSKIAEL